ncbi:MAG: glycosyl transferase [Candidatus Yanofskybacteria bacterium CG10_big_fil_rev_8_21_14_0_10_36_16]|uniref:Glycosyl transferase n=1 Tax=Candidatus Yanofskybacteria bacterium CG10_big_fil_rev_8_21_14_0_10_36_16 TaxID=1975096 RepID=A0A2J0Q7T1_9BACT|nr:MAG: glycosyl transferase [Candidatus Yanofskybacteria bacterium CG10_big_fil_rev_8_21_14_0_10_36_16]
MKTTLIIPALNEEGAIGKTLKEIPRNFIDEIIVIDGHSTDNTLNEAREALRNTDKVITQRRNGFGGALFDAVEIANGDVIMIMDADGSHNPNDIPKILEKFTNKNDVVMSSRYSKGARSDDDTLIRLLGNWIFTKLTNIIHKTNVSDSLYFFFAISRDNFKKLNLQNHGFGICIEFLVKAKRAGLTFKEIPAIERPRLAGKSKVNALKDGFKILKVILKKY